MENDIEKSKNEDIKQKENIEISTIDIPVDEPKLSFSSTRVTCFVCHSTVLTEVNYKNGCLWWLTCGGFKCLSYFCELIGFGLPCCGDNLKDVEHICSNCKYNLGTYSRFK